MFGKLASLAHANRRRVLFAAVIGAAIAAVFGSGVEKHMSPYGADDPSTQSVQATNRYQHAARRQIDPGVLALVSTGGVRSAGAERRVREVEARLRDSRDVAGVSSYYDSHDPAMVSRDGRSTYVVGYFQPKSDARLKDDATRLESLFAGQRVFLDIPTANLGCVRTAQELGLAEQRKLTRMVRGDSSCEALDLLWASSGPEKG